MKLTGEQHVRLLLSLIPYFEERQYSGNYYDNDDLNDIRDAIKRAELSDIQRQVIDLTFIQDMTHKAAGEMLGIARRMVSYYEARAVNLITEAYEKGKMNELDGT